ncbi:MAG: 50S ribosomal protein L4 [Gemmatimonadetes bacterium]|nr:50S ribosomal protein L4 [Gemmatimonadota bacterium]
MLEAHHFTAAAKRKGSYALPEQFDGKVNQPVLHQTIRAQLNNQRQGTAKTKTRGEVSGGNRKPWRQKGTGRARQGSTRAPNWPGGGKVFGPIPRSYHTGIPRKVRQLARASALNARANEGQIYVIEALEFEKPKTSQMAEMLEQLELSGRKVLVLTSDHRPEVYLSARNIPRVEVMAYGEASALDLMWADALVVEEAAVGGHAIRGSGGAKATTREKRAKKAAAAKKPAAAKPKAKRPAAKKKPAAKPAKKKDKSDA